MLRRSLHETLADIAESVSLNLTSIRHYFLKKEDLVAAAVNDAVRKVEKTTQEKMSGLTAGLGLPGGMKLPF